MCDADLAGGESGRVNEPEEEAADEEGVGGGGFRGGRDIQIMVRKEGTCARKEEKFTR